MTPASARDDLPVIDVDDVGEPTAGGSVSAVLLAAGASSRFDGENKLLADLEGEPLVRHAAHTLRTADVAFERVVAVVGHEAAAVRKALAGLDVEVVENPDYRTGQAASVRTGVSAVAHSDAAVFALGDMPFVAPGSVERLVRAYRAEVGSALAAAHEGERGNPVLFGAEHFDALRAVSGDTGGRDVLLASEDAALVETGDPGVLRDVDEPADIGGSD